jgi:hypothetical protein
MKVEGTEDSKIVEAVTIATDSKLVHSQDINACTLTDGQMYYCEPGSFHIHRARSGNNPQAGPPFVRFTAVMESPITGQTHTTMVECFLTSLVAVFYPPASPELEDENEDAVDLEPPSAGLRAGGPNG